MLHLRAITRLRTPLRSLPRILLTPFSSQPPPSPPLLRPPPPISPPSAPFSTTSSSRRRRGGGDAEADESDGAGVSLFGRDPTHPPKLFVVQPRLRPDSLLHSKLSEALNLANSLEERRDGVFAEDYGSKEPPPHLVVQNPGARSLRVHSDTYFGRGTVENVKCELRALETENAIDAIFVNAILSGIQQRNLEVSWQKPVLDRIGLIIEIFNAHAETKEAKLQSELAALMYKRTRLVRVRGPGGRMTFGTSGEAEVVSARGRGSGGRGFISGAGETELQLQRRRIQERRIHILSQIEEVRRTRSLQRYARRRHGSSYGQGLATVAVVGYTNAGKSTLVSALSESDLYSDDRLFATVDPRVRSVVLPSGKKALLSDTVGFISDLPVQLVEAFHATLEEVVEADLLVHVLDSSSPDLDAQREAVLQVLQQLGVSGEKIKNMIEVWNKIDLLESNGGADECFGEEEIIGEDEEEYPEDDMTCDPSSGKPVDEDDDAMASEFSQEESLDNADDVASEFSCGEHMDDNDDYDDGDIASDVSTEEKTKRLQNSRYAAERVESQAWMDMDPHDTFDTDLSLGLGIGPASTASADDCRRRQRGRCSPCTNLFPDEPSLSLSLSDDPSGGGRTMQKAEADRPAQLSSSRSAASSFSSAADEEENSSGRKKLRLTREQSALLEDRFKEHTTLNPKQKQALAKDLNLRPRQVEVWFQNRRARTKLKQTEVDCEFLKKCYEALTNENQRLQKELQELKALKFAQPLLHMQLPSAAAPLTMCPSCQRISGGGGDAKDSSKAPKPGHCLNPFSHSAAC
ncbi:unnamed protein product [Musa hybrid cultivar]